MSPSFPQMSELNSDLNSDNMRETILGPSSVIVWLTDILDLTINVITKLQLYAMLDAYLK